MDEMPYFSDFLDDLKQNELKYQVESTFSRFQWNKVKDSELQSQSMQPIPEEGTFNHKRNISDQKILDYFLENDMIYKNISNHILLNNLFEFPSFSTTMIDNVANKHHNNPDNRKTNTDNFDSKTKVPLTENKGQFFRFYNICCQRELNEPENKVFQKVLKFLSKLMLGVILNKNLISIKRFIQYKKFFEILISKSDELNNLIGLFANDCLFTFSDFNKKNRSNKSRSSSKIQKNHLFKCLSINNIFKKNTSILNNSNKLKIKSEITHKYKMFIILSWIFSSSQSQIKTIFIDKLDTIWKEKHKQKFMDKMIKENKLNITKFVKRLKDILIKYERQIQDEQIQIKEHFKFLWEKDQFVSDEVVQKAIKDNFAKQMRNYNNDLKGNKIFKLKEENIMRLMTKIELINEIRQMGRLLVENSKSISEEEFRQISTVFENKNESFEIKKIVRMYFLSLLETEFGLLDEYQEKFKPIFPELRQLKTDVTSLIISKEKQKQYSEMKQNIEGVELSKKQKYELVKDNKNFYFFATLILNNILTCKDLENMQEPNKLLDQNYQDIIDRFREKEKLKHKFLEKLSLGFKGSQYLSFLSRPNDPKPPLLEKGKVVIIINIMIWVLSCQEKHPLYLTLSDLKEIKTETNNYLFNVKHENNKESTGYYVVHQDAKNHLIGQLEENTSRFWHFVLHGFYLGICDVELINSNKLLKDIENGMKKMKLSKDVKPKEYLLSHFHNDLKYMKKPKQSVTEEWIASFFVESLSEFEKVENSREEHMKIAEQIGQSFENHRSVTSIITILGEARQQQSKKSNLANLFLRNFLRRTLRKDQIKQIKEPFLYSNLRQIRECTESDIIKILEKESNQGQFLQLRYLLKYKVSYLAFLIKGILLWRKIEEKHFRICKLPKRIQWYL